MLIEIGITAVAGYFFGVTSDWFKGRNKKNKVEKELNDEAILEEWIQRPTLDEEKFQKLYNIISIPNQISSDYNNKLLSEVVNNGYRFTIFQIEKLFVEMKKYNSWHGRIDNNRARQEFKNLVKYTRSLKADAKSTIEELL